MIDKRPFYALLGEIKQTNPDDVSLIESIEGEFTEIASISDSEKRALRQYPMQFIKRITNDHDEWTTQLHIWAENGVSDILDLDPTFLAFKNSYGDSVLMSIAVGATGTHTGVTDYELIKKMLDGEYIYDDIQTTSDGKQTSTTMNAMDETDINGLTPIDYIKSVAYATGDYEGEDPDVELQQLIPVEPVVVEDEEPESPLKTETSRPSSFGDFL